MTTGYKEESIAELVGEVMYTCRIRNPDLNFSAIAVGKWGNIRECHTLDNSSNESVCFSIKCVYSADQD